jgi:hypothetical protein
MADETSNLVLEHLRHIRGAVDDMRAEMKHFIMHMELAERHDVNLHVADATQNIEIDRARERLERIERRLEPTEAEGVVVRPALLRV